jgi:two-component system cell cycle sensor histidine kinase/response regulator CckA
MNDLDLTTLPTPKGGDRTRKGEGISEKTENILHMILANVEDLIAVVDLNGKRLYNSPSYARILGDKERLRGSDSFAEIHPDDRPMVKQVFRETVQTGRGRRIEYRFAVPGRPIRYIESQGNAIRDELGRVAKIVIVSRDITERKRIEEERGRLQMAVEQAAESIVITAADGTILYVNPAFERVTGYPKDEVLGANPRILKSGVHDDLFYKTMWTTLLRGEIWSGEVTNRKRDGSLYAEEMVISPVRDSSGEVINYVALKRDITLQKQLEQQARQAQKMESLTQISGGIAHDFNNILNIVEGCFALLRPHVKDEHLQQYFAMGEAAIARGIDVGRQLTSFARSDKPQLVPVAVGTVIAQLGSDLKRSLERTVEIQTSVDADLPRVQGDQSQLYQSLLTLCINARDAIILSPAASCGGTIRIEAHAVEGRDVKTRFHDATANSYVRLSVSDNGVGMTDEIRQRIFEPFLTTTNPTSGKGIGLAGLYNVVKCHHGLIDVQTELGKGTTFSIYLPSLPVEEREPAVPDASDVRGGSETILVVEDEEPVRFLLEESLKQKGYIVLSARDGAEGLAMYTEHHGHIHAVISDMGLPKLSGYDMFVKIRAVNPSARVLMSSGFLDPTLKSKLSLAGVRAFVPKPYRPIEMIRKLREVLEVPE